LHDARRSFSYASATSAPHVEFKDSDRREWPDLMAAPHISQRIGRELQTF